MGLTDKIFDALNITDTTSATKELTAIPKKKGEPTTFQNPNYPPGDYHQMDLLFLPEDTTKNKDEPGKKKVSSKKGKKGVGKTTRGVSSPQPTPSGIVKTAQKRGYRYLLVITDIGSGAVDAKPLKNKEGEGVLKAVQDVYKSGKYLKEPKFIHVDAGNEFFLMKSHYIGENIGVRVASVGRHSQQAVVEAMNKTIGSVIMKLQLHNELITGDVETGWIEYLPTILKTINEEKKKTKPKKAKAKKNPENVLCKKEECDLYEIGMKVRVKLDYPKNVRGERQIGAFRAGDIRWSVKPHTIENILLLPNQPIRYVVSGIKTNTFSKWELKPYKAVKMDKLAGKEIAESIVEVFKGMGSKNSKNVDKLRFRIKFEGKELTEKQPYPANEYRTRKQLNDAGIDDDEILALMEKGEAEFPKLKNGKPMNFSPLSPKKK